MGLDSFGTWRAREEAEIRPMALCPTKKKARCILQTSWIPLADCTNSELLTSHLGPKIPAEWMESDFVSHVLETGPQLTFGLGLPGARSTGVSINGSGHGVALISDQHLIKVNHDRIESWSDQRL